MNTPKPCPWCGNVDLSAAESELPKYWAVHCGCGIHGPEVRVLIKATDDEKAKVAFEAWNNRPLGMTSPYLPYETGVQAPD